MRLQEISCKVFTVSAHFLLICFNCLLSVPLHTNTTPPWGKNNLFLKLKWALQGPVQSRFLSLKNQKDKAESRLQVFFTATSYSELTLNHIISDTKALMTYIARETFYKCGHILKYTTIQFLTLFSYILYQTQNISQCSQGILKTVQHQVWQFTLKESCSYRFKFSLCCFKMHLNVDSLLS